MSDPDLQAIATLEEVVAALKLLHADRAAMKRILAYACRKLRRNKFHSGEDALNESFERMLDGRRPWKKNARTFYQQTRRVISSICSEFNEQSDAERFPAISPHDQPSEDGSEIVVACTKRRADFAIQAAQEHKAFWDQFAEHENCKAVLAGRENYMTAKQIKEAYKLTEKQYDSATKQIWRVMQEHYPEGVPL